MLYQNKRASDPAPSVVLIFFYLIGRVPAAELHRVTVTGITPRFVAPAEVTSSVLVNF